MSRPEEFWDKLHKKFVETTLKQGKQIHLVFYGHSITQGWSMKEGINTWKQYYGHLSAVNYGIGGDRTEHLIYRISNGEVNGLNPKVVVLKIGTNNMGINNASGIGHRTSDIGHRASGIGHRASGIGHRTSDVGHRTSHME